MKKLKFPLILLIVLLGYATLLESCLYNNEPINRETISYEIDSLKVSDNSISFLIKIDSIYKRVYLSENNVEYVELNFDSIKHVKINYRHKIQIPINDILTKKYHCNETYVLF